MTQLDQLADKFICVRKDVRQLKKLLKELLLEAKKEKNLARSFES